MARQIYALGCASDDLVRDGWRKKDLEAERGSDSIRQLGQRIRRLREAEKLQADEREAAMKAIAGEMGWAGMRGKGVRALAVEESWVRRMALVEKELGDKAARALAAPGVFGGEAGAARSLVPSSPHRRGSGQDAEASFGDGQRERVGEEKPAAQAGQTVRGAKGYAFCPCGNASHPARGTR